MDQSNEDEDGKEMPILKLAPAVNPNKTKPAAVSSSIPPTNPLPNQASTTQSRSAYSDSRSSNPAPPPSGTYNRHQKEEQQPAAIAAAATNYHRAMNGPPRTAPRFVEAESADFISWKNDPRSTTTTSTRLPAVNVNPFIGFAYNPSQVSNNREWEEPATESHVKVMLSPVEPAVARPATKVENKPAWLIPTQKGASLASFEDVFGV